MNIERGNCRFRVASTPDGKPGIRLELYYDTVASLRGRLVGFELLRGTTLEEAKRLADVMNERIVGIEVGTEGERS